MIRDAEKIQKLLSEIHDFSASALEDNFYDKGSRKMCSTVLSEIHDLLLQR